MKAAVVIENIHFWLGLALVGKQFMTLGRGEEIGLPVDDANDQARKDCSIKRIWLHFGNWKPVAQKLTAKNLELTETIPFGSRLRTRSVFIPTTLNLVTATQAPARQPTQTGAFTGGCGMDE